MEGPISFWGYKEQESNLILPEHDDDDDDDDDEKKRRGIKKIYTWHNATTLDHQTDKFRRDIYVQNNFFHHIPNSSKFHKISTNTFDW